MHDHTRREFLALSAAVGAASLVVPSGFGLNIALAQQAKTAADGGGVGKVVRIGLVGCGGRGSGAANDSLTANPNVKIVAMADVDLTKAKGARDALKEAHGDRVDVPDERIFGGLDGYLKICDLKDVDLVLLATAPGFRPIHIAAAVATRCVVRRTILRRNRAQPSSLARSIAVNRVLSRESSAFVKA
jgi:myo-inositol 2-dehydrogenase/D-chiro-inositol 1-dehydrogenase